MNNKSYSKQFIFFMFNTESFFYADFERTKQRKMNNNMYINNMDKQKRVICKFS